MSTARASSEHRRHRAAAPRDEGPLQSYRLFGYIVSSELPLPELPSCSAAADLVIRRAPAGKVRPAQFATCHEWRVGGEVSCRVARGEEGHLLSFPPAVDFLLTADREVLCAPRPGAGEGLVRHLLLNQVLPRWLAHAGELVLHASAVTLPGGRTVAIAGEAGRGKSTLAFYCRGQGAQLVDDDCVLLRFSEQGVRIAGGIPTVRLHAASLGALGADPAAFSPFAGGSDKRQMRLAQAESSRAACPVSLDALFLLGGADTRSTVDSVQIEPAMGRAAVPALAGSAFNLDPSAHDTMARTFRQVARLVEGVPVCHLRYPRDYSLLPQVWRALLAYSGS